MNIFGSAPCPLSTLNVTVRRNPPVVGGSAFSVKIRVTRVSAPNANKAWGEKQSCETAKAFKKMPAGTYRITAEPDPADGYYFDVADAKDVVLPATSTVNQEVVIRPLTLTVTPNAPWTQYVNLELTPDGLAEGCDRLPFDVQEKRAAAALIAANASGNAEWIRQATAISAGAVAKRMNPKQMGRVLVVEARINRPIEGVKVYVSFRPDVGNEAWAGASDDSRAALSRKGSATSDWERKVAKDAYVKTDVNGVATARLRLSRFGGDKYKVVASLLPDPLNNGKSVSTGDVTVWRKIWYQPTYPENYPLYSLAQAANDFTSSFIELEMIDPRPYAAGVTPGATEQDAWQFDKKDRKGTLPPGQSANLEVVVQADAPGPLPQTAVVKFKKTTAPAVTVRRPVKLFRLAVLSVTDPDLTLADKKVGEAFTPLSGSFLVRNKGDVPLKFTVTKTQPWLRLKVASGTAPGAGTLAVPFDLDGVALSSFDPGSYQDTLTFTNADDATQTKTKKVKLKVLANPDGALAVTPPEGILTLGAIGGPFTGAKTWTLTNKGAKKILFSAPSPAEDWLTVLCPAVVAVKDSVPGLEKEAKEADEKATPLEAAAADLDAKAKAKEENVPKVAESAAAETNVASEASVKREGEATSARADVQRLTAEDERVAQKEDERVQALEEQARIAPEEAATAQSRASATLGRATTAEARATAEAEQETADEANERAATAPSKVDAGRLAATKAKDAAHRAVTDAERDATDKERQASDAKQKLVEVREKGQKAEDAAGLEAREARAAAVEKKKEADAARKTSNEKKALATTAKDHAARSIASLDPGASTTVTATIKGPKANALGALPATSSIVLTDETNHRTQSRVVTLAKPGLLTVTGADIAKTQMAGEFDATSTTYTLKNDGGADLDYTVAKVVDWVTTDVESGTLAAAATVAVTVTVSTAAANTFEQGAHTTKVTLTDTTHGVAIDKDVTLTVTANPAGVLCVTPWQDLVCIGVAGGPYAPALRLYTLKNIGGAPLTYQVTQTQTWVTASTPGRIIAIGDHNKAAFWNLRQQPAVQRPRTVQLLVCKAQCDPADCEPIATTSASRSLVIAAASVVNGGGRTVDVHKPALDGNPVVVSGTWTWDGHTGPIQDAHVSVKRGRAGAGSFVLDLPATCPAGCSKVGCAGGTAVVPTAVSMISISDLVVHGHRGFLGEGGYEDRPTCLIVAKENQVDDFNDTVSHELGHMMKAVLHDAAYHQTATDKTKENHKQAAKSAKNAPANPVLQANEAAWQALLDHAQKNHRYYWPKGVPVHPLQYDQGQGNHCGVGGTSTAVPVTDSHSGLKYASGTCILYASGRDVKLTWCPNCIKQFTFVDLRRFTYSE
jgi:hypothetical protein